MLEQACQDLTLETTRATFWEAVKFYPEYMSTWEPDPNMHIACWYGKKEMNMKKAIKNLKRAFPNTERSIYLGLTVRRSIRPFSSTSRTVAMAIML